MSEQTTDERTHSACVCACVRACVCVCVRACVCLVYSRRGTNGQAELFQKYVQDRLFLALRGMFIHFLRYFTDERLTANGFELRQRTGGGNNWVRS